MQQPLEFQPAPHTDYVFQAVGLDWPHLLAFGLVLAGAVGAGLWLRSRRSTRE